MLGKNTLAYFEEMFRAMKQERKFLQLSSHENCPFVF